MLQPPSLAGAYSRQAKLKQEQKQREVLERLELEKAKERALMRRRKQETE